jgi:hypothetical protein
MMGLECSMACYGERTIDLSLTPGQWYVTDLISLEPESPKRSEVVHMKAINATLRME